VSAASNTREGSQDDRFHLQGNLLLWGTFLVGLVAGFVSVYLVVAQPLIAQVDTLHRDMSGMQGDLKELVGVRDQVHEANTLLSALKVQRQQIEDARLTLVSLRELRQDLQVESHHTTQSAATLKQLVQMQSMLREQQELTPTASKALEDMAQVQRRLVQEHGMVPTAQATMADLEQTKVGLAELLRIKQQLLDGSRDVNEASVTAGALVALKDLVQGHKGDLDAARLYVNKLFALEAELASHQGESTKAWASLDRMLELNGKLLDKGPQVAEAITNLELFNDFQEEFSERIKALASMRQALSDVAQLEPTIAKISRILEPLANIANVRRLNENELRDAARVILEKRSATRLSQKPAEPKVYAEERDPFQQAEERASGKKASTPVPVPTSEPSTGEK
jgi:hypothetical protein